MNCPAQPEVGWSGTKYLRRCSLAVVVVWVICGISCHRPSKASDSVTVEFQIEPKPAQVGAVDLYFTFSDAGGLPVTRAEASVEADMSHAGMSPVFAAVHEAQPGHYESHLALGMAGDWVVLLHG